MSELLLSAKALAVLLDVSVRQIRRLQITGKVPAPLYVGRLPRWRETEIHAWMTAGCPNRAEFEALRKAVK